MTEMLAPEVVNSFLDVVVRYLRSAVGVEAVIAAIGEPPSATQTIAVALDFKGDVRGPVTWVFPQRIVLELVRRLMCTANGPIDVVLSMAKTGRFKRVV